VSLYNDDVTEAWYKNIILVLTLMMTMIVLIIVNYLLISRRLEWSIREVIAGSEVFATGNLDYRISITSNDEISGIAKQLNEMAEQIYQVTASKVDLENEIGMRKTTEEALNQANIKLNLLSGITRHDIKNKVVTIQGFLRFARKTKDVDEIQPFLDKIQDSAKVIEYQINFSKD